MTNLSLVLFRGMFQIYQKEQGPCHWEEKLTVTDGLSVGMGDVDGRGVGDSCMLPERELEDV